MHNFVSILKLFTECVEQAFMYPHVKYLSDESILEMCHKLAYNYWYT